MPVHKARFEQTSGFPAVWEVYGSKRSSPSQWDCGKGDQKHRRRTSPPSNLCYALRQRSVWVLPSHTVLQLSAVLHREHATALRQASCRHEGRGGSAMCFLCIILRHAGSSGSQSKTAAIPCIGQSEKLLLHYD